MSSISPNESFKWKGDVRFDPVTDSSGKTKTHLIGTLIQEITDSSTGKVSTHAYQIKNTYDGSLSLEQARKVQQEALQSLPGAIKAYRIGEKTQKIVITRNPNTQEVKVVETRLKNGHTKTHDGTALQKQLNQKINEFKGSEEFKGVFSEPEKSIPNKIREIKETIDQMESSARKTQLQKNLEKLELIYEKYDCVMRIQNIGKRLVDSAITSSQNERRKAKPEKEEEEERLRNKKEERRPRIDLKSQSFSGTPSPKDQEEIERQQQELKRQEDAIAEKREQLKEEAIRQENATGSPTQVHSRPHTPPPEEEIGKKTK